jgi:hypothetical protein
MRCPVGDGTQKGQDPTSVLLAHTFLQDLLSHSQVFLDAKQTLLISKGCEQPERGSFLQKRVRLGNDWISWTAGSQGLILSRSCDGFSICPLSVGFWAI